MHPLISDLSTLKDQEIHAKISDLTRKYYMTRNPDVQWQIAGVLDDLRLEVRARNARQMQDTMKNGNNNLDSLIKVS
jgi:hypothetical protein